MPTKQTIHPGIQPVARFGPADDRRWKPRQVRSNKPRPLRHAAALSLAQMAFSMSQSCQNELLHREATKQYRAKQVVFYKGDAATHLFVVVSGKLKVSAPSDDGKEIIFGIVGLGDLVGEMSMVEGAEHTATVTALERTELVALNRSEFVALLETSPGIAIKLLTMLCEKLRWAREFAEDISFLTLAERLAKRLSYLARHYGEITGQGIRIVLHLYQQELANLVGTSRESINKQLREWTEQGWVVMDNGYLTITNIRELESLAEERSGVQGLSIMN